MKFNTATGFFILFFVAHTNMFAQQPVVDTLTLKGIEVTGIGPGVEKRSAAPVQRMGISTLNALPGNSAADALRNFSGVTIKDYGGLGGLKTVVVRSLGANHTGIFVDGVPLSDAASGQIDLGKIPLEDLEVIELTIGQGQELCQPARAQASASLLGFHSITPGFEHSKLQVKTGLKTGSFGVINPYGSIYLKTGTQTFAGISADYNHTRGDYPYVLKNGNLPDTTLSRSNADMEAINLNFRMETRFNDSSVLKVKAWFYGSERGLPGAVIFYNPFSAQRLSNRDIFSNLQYSRNRGKVQMLSNLNFSNNNLRYRDPVYLNEAGGLDNRYIQQEFYLSQAVSWPLKGVFSMGAAADLLINHMLTDQYSGGNPTRISGLGSVSLQAKTNTTEATAVLLGTVVHESQASGDAMRLRRVLSPSFSFITRLTSLPLLRFRLMYKNSFRMPTFHDLYYHLVGNDKLKPEFVNQLNAGLILTEELGPVQISLLTDVFVNQVKDKIVAVPTQNLFVWSMRNLGKVDTRGIEIQAGIKTLLKNSSVLSMNLNYTHQQALDMSNPESSTYRQQIPYVPFQTMSGLLTLGGKRLTIGYNILYNSHLYVLGENIPGNLLPSWWVHDVALSWQQPWNSFNWKIKAEAINLFNRQYEVIRGFPMNGRGFYITISINY